MQQLYKMRKRPFIENQIQFWRTHVSPPRQILDKNKKVHEHELRFKSYSKNITIEFLQNQIAGRSRNQYIRNRQNNSVNKRQSENSHEESYFQSNLSLPVQSLENITNAPLTERYKFQKPIYLRYNNQTCNSKFRKAYFSSFFFKLDSKKKYPDPIFKCFEESKVTSKQLLDTFNKFKFNSEFESGNLYSVFYIGNNQFDLILQNDTNSKGNNQWYYFSVSNKIKNQVIKINIINFYKSHSLYSEGMKPLAFSMTANKSSNGPGWCRYGNYVNYYNSQIKIENSQTRYYYTLSFEFKFDYDNDTVYFSNCYPYTVSHLYKFLKQIQLNEDFVIVKNIGTTLLKNNIPMIMIGEDIKEKDKKYRTIPNYAESKESIIIMARQHPGQTPGSFVCQGFVKSILTDGIQSRFLLSKYNFFVFPMVNIDGVINGNYRGNAYGYDLNRVWKNEKIQKHPQVFYVKNQIRKIGNRSNIYLVLDFHGHSKKLNSFFFANYDEKNPDKPRMLPLMASKLNPHISFKDSTFHQQEEKYSTARISLKYLLAHHKQCQIYTFESSFYGTIKNNKKVHFTMDDYRNLGNSIYLSIYKKQSQLQKQIKNLKQSPVLRQIRKQLGKIILQSGLNQNKEEESDSQADNNPIQIQQIDMNNSIGSVKNIQINSTLKTNQSSQQKFTKKRKHKHNRIITSKQLKQEQSQTDFDTQIEQQYQLIKPNIKLDVLKSEIEKRNMFFNTNKSIYMRSQNQTYKEYLLQKMNVKGQMYDESLHEIQPLKTNNKYVQTFYSYLKGSAILNQASTLNLTKRNKVNDFHFNNLSLLQNYKKKQIQKITEKSSIQNTKLQNLNIGTMTQMMKIRKINGRVKARSSSFRQQYIVEAQGPINLVQYK